MQFIIAVKTSPYISNVNCYKTFFRPLALFICDANLWIYKNHRNRQISAYCASVNELNNSHIYKFSKSRMKSIPCHITQKFSLINKKRFDSVIFFLQSQMSVSDKETQFQRKKLQAISRSFFFIQKHLSINASCRQIKFH